MRKNNDSLSNHLQTQRNQLQNHEREYQHGLDNINKSRQEKQQKESELEEITKKLEVVKQKEIPTAVLNQYKEM